MSVLVVGLSHRSAPVELLERVALDPDAVAKLTQDVTTTEHVGEAVVLATCNRLETYAEVDKFHGSVADISELLARHSGVPLEELTPHLYVHYEDRAVQHVFTVACGLDSMLVGEREILGQVRHALRAAQEGNTAGRVLNELLQQSLRVGKRARSETAIDSAGRSLVTVGLQLGEQALGPLAERTALVVGAGAMSRLAATTLQRAGLGEIVVANRTLASGERLAASVGGRAVPLRDLGAALVAADVVVSCTGALDVVVPASLVAEARSRRAPGAGSPTPSPQFFLDLALPRDVDPEVRALPGCTVVDLQWLAAALGADGTGEEVLADIEAAQRIVADETGVFAAWQRAAAVAPTVVALRAMAAEVVAAELARLATRVPGLADPVSAEVATTVRRVVDKLLHGPTVRVQELAGISGGPGYADALRELFGLDPTTVAAVSRPAVAAPMTTEMTTEMASEKAGESVDETGERAR